MNSENEIQGQLFPILRSKNQWFVTPQYLAPQILEILTSDEKINAADKNIWENGEMCDVWSLGCTIFQMITLIPLWSVNRCYIKDRPKIHRKGLMGVEGRNLTLLKQKQKKLQKNMRKCLINEVEVDLNPKIIEVILKMVQFNPNQRIRLSEILAKLK